MSALSTQPTDQELIEYREQVDQGNKVAFPMLFDGLGPDPEPPALDADDIQLIGGDLMEARERLFAAARIANRPSSRHLHAQLAEMVEEIGRIQSDLAARGDGRE